MEGSPYSIDLKQEGEKLILRFSGQLIINHISKIADHLKSILGFEYDIDINIDKPENIDVTFIQLLYSIKSDFISNNKKVTITGDLKIELETLISNSGFQLLQN